jgi:hypothetical protein
MNNKITDTHISILVPISRYQYTDMDIGASLNTTAFKVLYCAGQLLNLGVKKNTCGSGSRLTLFFSADPIIFSTRLTVRPYFLFLSGCGLLTQRAKMASVVTLIIEPNCLNSSIGNMHF